MIFGQRPEGGRRELQLSSSYRDSIRSGGNSKIKDLEAGSCRSQVLLRQGQDTELRCWGFVLRITGGHGRIWDKADWRLNLGFKKLPLASSSGGEGAGEHVSGGSGREGLSWR